MLARHRGLSCLLFLLAASSLRIIAETTPAAALNLAIAKFHERGGGVQEEEDDNNHRRSYFVKLCPTRLETYDKLIERLNGDKVYFFNLSEACPGIVVTDSDGYNYVAVDSRSGVVSFFYPFDAALDNWKDFLRAHPLHVWAQADAEEIAQATVDLTGEHSEMALYRDDLRQIVHRSFDEAVTADCDRTALSKQFQKWWTGYEELGIGVGRKVTPLVQGYRVELTYGKNPDFVLLNEYFDVPYVERLEFTISDGKFELEKSALYPAMHRWNRHIECKPIHISKSNS